MGDRANISVIQPDGGRIYLYTHWDGFELPQRLRDRLEKGRNRWDDAPYLARIIFDELTHGDRSTTGFGICNYVQDNNRPILVVNCNEKTVTIEDASGKCDGKSITFAAFVAMKTVEWQDLYTR